MSVGVNGTVRFLYLNELLRDLGGVPTSRVRMHPAPGTAALRDLIRIGKKDNRVYELVDGTLVAKPMAFSESNIAALLLTAIQNFLATNNLGMLTGEQGLMRLLPGLARGPDVAFVSWAQLPGHH